MSLLRACLVFLLLFLSAATLRGQAAIDGSWQCLDLGLLRSREAAETAPRPRELPVQRVEEGGIPYLYSAAKGPWRLCANGQRLSLAPNEGGRFYELAIAGRCELSGDGVLEWELLGNADRSTLVRARLLPREEGHYRLVLASTFPLQALRLPKNPGLEIHALSLRWVADGPNDKAFARAFIEQSRNDPVTARWLKHTLPGGLLSTAPGEDETLRVLFDAQLAGDEAAAQARLGERMAILDGLSSASKQDRVRLCLAVTPGRSADESTLVLLSEALHRWPELRAVVGGSAGIKRLARSHPDARDRLIEAARDGRLEIAGWQSRLSWAVLPDAVEYRADFEAGAAWVQAAGLSSAAHPAVLGDPSAQPTFAELCMSAGRFRALLWAGDPAPRLSTLRTPAGKALLLVTIPAARAAIADNDVLTLLERSAASTGVRDALLPIEMPADLDAVEALLKQAIELTEAPDGPSYSWGTPMAAFDQLRQAAAFKPDPSSMPVTQLPMTLAPYAERAAAEQLRVLREDVWRAASFASFAGLRVLRRVLDDPQATTDSLQRELRDALGVLARSIDTKGSGTPLLVFNLLAHERAAVVECAMPAGTSLQDAKGRTVPTAELAPGRRIFRAQVPALGHALYRIVEGAEPAAASAAREQDGRWSGSRLAFAVDASSGELTSLRVLPEGIELLGGPSNRLLGMEGEVQCSVRVAESNAVRLVLGITREAVNARVEQELVLDADAVDLAVRTSITRLSKGAPPRLVFAWREGTDRLRAELAGGVALIPLEGRQASGWIPARRFVAGVRESLGLGIVRAAQGRVAILPQELRIELSEKVGAETLLLRPYLEPAGAVRLALAAEELASPLRVLSTDAHDGVRVGTQSFLTHGRNWTGGTYAAGERSGLMLEAVRTGDAPGQLDLRYRECNGEGGELEVSAAQRIFGVERFDPRENTWKPLRHERSNVHVPITPDGTVRLRLRMRP